MPSKDETGDTPHRAGVFSCPSVEGEEREHPAGFALLGAVGIVTIEMCGGAGAAIVHLPNAGGARLLEKGAGEIDFVARRADARAELRDELARLAPELANHSLDGDGDDTELRAFAPGVQQADDVPAWIGEKNRAAIRDVDAEANGAIRGEQSIRRAHRRARVRVHGRDVRAVHLLRANEAPLPETERGARGSVRTIRALERDRAIPSHINP